jgi:hypothetical protein
MSNTKIRGIGVDPKLYRIFGRNPVITEGHIVSGRRNMSRRDARELAKKPTLSQKDFNREYLIKTNDGTTFFRVSQENSLFRRNRNLDLGVLKKILSNPALSSKYYSWRDAFAKMASGHDTNQIKWLGSDDQLDVQESILRDEEYAITEYEQKNSISTQDAHEKFHSAAQKYFHKRNGTNQSLLDHLDLRSLTASQKSWFIGALCDNYLFDKNQDGSRVLKEKPDYFNFSKKYNQLSKIPNNVNKPKFSIRNNNNGLVTEKEVENMFQELMREINAHISKEGSEFLLKHPNKSYETLKPQIALSERLKLAQESSDSSLDSSLIRKNYFVEAYKICELHFPQKIKELNKIRELLIDNIWSILLSQGPTSQNSPS